MRKTPNTIRYLLILAAFSITGTFISWDRVSRVTFGAVGDELECGNIEAHTSIGVFLGKSALELHPLELWGINGPAAWPAANPILTPSHIAAYPDAIGSPFLLTDSSMVYMFFEAVACASNHRAIMVAESIDSGVTWQMLGTVLTSQSHDSMLRRPSIFKYSGQYYMVTDSDEGPRLYKATKFPMAWEFERMLINEPIQGVSLVQLDIDSNNWLLFGSTNHGEHYKERVTYISNSPLGNWQQLRPAQGLVTTTAVAPAGPSFMADGSIYRLNRVCAGHGACNLVAFNVTITSGSFTETSMEFGLGLRPWRQMEAWDHGGYRHASVIQLPSGLWIAAAAGSSPPYKTPALNWQVALVVAIMKVLALFAAGVLFMEGFAAMSYGKASAPPPSLLPTIKTSRHSSKAAVAAAAVAEDSHRNHVIYSGNNNCAYLTDYTPPTTPKHPDEIDAFSPLAYHGPSTPLTKRSSAGNAVAALLAEVGAATAAQMARDGISAGNSAGGPISAAAVAAEEQPGSQKLHGKALNQGKKRRNAGIAALIMVTAIFIATTGHRFRSVATPFWQPSYPVLVQGHYSKFTLMVMSYEARMRTLKWYVKHYSTCSSVGEVLVVWNKGLPPIPVKDFPDAAVPIRIRVEEQNSMNNRYKPDPEIRHRAVLSLDDDLLLPCADLERAFALWRLDPARLVGYFPRLVEPAQPPPEVESAVSAEEVALAAAGGLVQGGEVRYHGEPEAIRRGRYNMILSGAAFIDSQSYFPAYWSEELSPARDLVNELRNCDDMLMNFVVGNVTRDWGLPNPDPVQQKKEPMFVPVDYVRAQRRLDVSHFSGVGISHDADHFIADAEECLTKFQGLFAGLPLRTQLFDWNSVDRPECSSANVLDCKYLD